MSKLPIAVLPNGLPVYGISGSEPSGYSTEGDLVSQLIDGTDLNAVWTEFLATLDIVNQQRSTTTNHLAFRTVSSADAVAQTVGDDNFEVASEFGEPTSLASPPELLVVGYPFIDYDKATRFTWKFLRDATVAELEALHARALFADNKLTTTAILRRVLNSTAGVNSDGRNVYGLFNGDTMVPPRHGFVTHTAPHQHYLTTGSATADGADLDVMIKHITHHGYGTVPGSQLLLFVNPADMPPIAQIRAATAGAAYDFIPSAGAPAYLTDKEIIGDTAPAEYNRLRISGSYGPVWITENEFIPPGYMLMAATGGPGNDLNVVGFREHPSLAHQGLRLLPGNRNGYPLADSFYTRGFGVGVRHRGAAVAMQVTVNANYTAPVL